MGFVITLFPFTGSSGSFVEVGVLTGIDHRMPFDWNGSLNSEMGL